MEWFKSGIHLLLGVYLFPYKHLVYSYIFMIFWVLTLDIELFVKISLVLSYFLKQT